MELINAVRDIVLSSASSHGAADPLRLSARVRKESESGLASSGFSSIFSYGIEDLPHASKFRVKDMEALRVNFFEALNESDVIPDVRVTIPDTLVRPEITAGILSNLNFRKTAFANIDDKKIRTLFKKLHKCVINGVQLTSTTEKFTDALVDDLLRIVELNDSPFGISNHPLCKLYIQDDACVSSNPEFVVELEDDDMDNFAVIIIEHLKNVGQATRFGETQISAEVLACVSENVRNLGSLDHHDQTLWVVRVISTYVTFYKAMIPAGYLKELDGGLPQQHSVKIQRWPAKNGLRTGFDLASPEGRRNVLEALCKIRDSLLNENDV